MRNIKLTIEYDGTAYSGWQVQKNKKTIQETTELTLKKLFKENIQMRIRPGYFPFVEPGFEVDIKDRSDKWLEVIGAGMIHPQILKNVKLDPSQWQGFAFGMGLDRITMMKYKIDDIRLFHSGDLRFIRQF